MDGDREARWIPRIVAIAGALGAIVAVQDFMLGDLPKRVDTLEGLQLEDVARMRRFREEFRQGVEQLREHFHEFEIEDVEFRAVVEKDLAHLHYLIERGGR